jgi:putative hydrolase of HD superfamily
LSQLIIVGGLPGVGKTTIARELSRLIGAVHLRIDSVEEALRRARLYEGSLDDAGYRAAYAVAEDNLRVGLTVIADCVNPLELTRAAWRDVAHRAAADLFEVEIQCADADEHRRRVEARTADIEGLRLPTWQEVIEREYHPWTRDPIRIDTSASPSAESVEALRRAIFPGPRRPAAHQPADAPAGDRLTRQVAFLLEADRLKTVLRRTPLTDASRLENSAEHSWHLMLAALVLHESVGDVDLARVLGMLAVHDLVEIDAGDTFAYDAAGIASKAEREGAAAERIFGLLPDDQRGELRGLWEEFEAQATASSRFANALDRFQPLLQNAAAGGGSWRTHGLHRAQVLQRMAPVETALPAVWPTVVRIIDTFCASGVIRTR